MKPEQAYEHKEMLKMLPKQAAQHLEKFGLLIRVEDFGQGMKTLHYQYINCYWFVDIEDGEATSHTWCSSEKYYAAFGAEHLKTLNVNGGVK